MLSFLFFLVGCGSSSSVINKNVVLGVMVDVHAFTSKPPGSFVSG